MIDPEDRPAPIKWTVNLEQIQGHTDKARIEAQRKIAEELAAIRAMLVAILTTRKPT